jgi:hypothetical protein
MLAAKQSKMAPPPPTAAAAAAGRELKKNGLAAMLAAKQSAMHAEGVSTKPVIVRSRSGGSSSPRKGANGDSNDTHEDEPQEKLTKSLFWKKIKPADIQGTLFARLKKMEGQVDGLAANARMLRVCVLDEPQKKVLCAKFATRVRKRQLTEAERIGQEVGAIGGVLKKGSLTFLPAQRFNNIAISLKQIHLTAAQVSAAVLSVDTRVLDSVAVETLLPCAPMGDDVESLEPFFDRGDDPEMLATVERFWYVPYHPIRAHNRSSHIICRLLLLCCCRYGILHEEPKIPGTGGATLGRRLETMLIFHRCVCPLVLPFDDNVIPQIRARRDVSQSTNRARGSGMRRAQCVRGSAVAILSGAQRGQHPQRYGQ